MVNGITLNNLTFQLISFQLPINTIQEFKLTTQPSALNTVKAPARL